MFSTAQLIHSELERLTNVPWYINTGQKVTDPILKKYQHYLKPIQVSTLQRISNLDNNEGCLINVPMGSGKTLISLLIPLIVPCRRPLLIVPPAAQKDFKLEFSEKRKLIPELMPIRMLSSGMLSTEKGKNLIKEIAPDLIIVDEVQMYQNFEAVRTYKMFEYINKMNVRFFGLSATCLSYEVEKFAHILQMVAKDNNPLPNSREIVLMMKELFKDEESYKNNVNLFSVRSRIINTSRYDTLEDWLPKRLTQCENIVTSNIVSSNQPLSILEYKYPIPDGLSKHIKKLDDDWVLPNGEPIVEAIEWHIQMNYMSLGFYRVQVFSDLSLKTAYLESRRDWFKVIRGYMLYHRTDILDAPSVVTRLAEKGRLNRSEQRAYERYLKYSKVEVVNDYVDVVEPSFISDRVSEFTSQHENLLVWFTHNRVAEKTGLEYFTKGDTILDPKKRHIALSANSFYAIKNLQAWNNNLLLEPILEAKRFRQLVARTHRMGQQKQVTVWINSSTPFLERKFYTTKSNLERLLKVTEG
jgi:hypothetical protein